jgi:hypothetical protein
VLFSIPSVIQDTMYIEPLLKVQCLRGKFLLYHLIEVFWQGRLEARTNVCLSIPISSAVMLKRLDKLRSIAIQCSCGARNGVIESNGCIGTSMRTNIVRISLFLARFPRPIPCKHKPCLELTVNGTGFANLVIPFYEIVIPRGLR